MEGGVGGKEAEEERRVVEWGFKKVVLGSTSRWDAASMCECLLRCGCWFLRR